MTEARVKQAHQTQTRWLGLSVAMWVFVAALCGLPMVGFLAMKSHAEHEALRDAGQFSRVISVMRSYYNNNVAQRIMASGGRQITLSDKYHHVPGSVPIPATLSIELGDLIRERELDDGFSMAFVSDAPFQTRERPPLDAFQMEALQTFRQNPALNDLWRVVSNSQGGQEVRLAIPVRMEANCVACHNGHPASPIRSWRVGDVRGIQDVSVGVQLAEQSEESYYFALYLLLFIAATFHVLAEHRRSNARLNELNEELRLSQDYLEDSELQLKRRVNELTNLTTVVDKAPFGIAFTAPGLPHRPVVYANEAFTRLTGYTGEELIGKRRALFPGPSTQPDALARIEDAIAQERTAEVEVIFHRKDGEPYWNRLLTFPSYDRDGLLLNTVVCYTDISGLKAAENDRQKMAAELQESLKLESLGVTIAGIAHDLNTPIGVALTASTHLARQVQKIRHLVQQTPLDAQGLLHTADGASRTLPLVSNNLGKAAELVRSFKQTTADASRSEWRSLELKPYLESLLVSVSPLLKRARCQTELACPEGLSLYTDPGALMQVIANLMVNATVHAFEDQTDRRLWLTVTEHPDRVELVVQDNGQGMSEEALRQAFTPFFTTRRQAGGSGLGLFSSRRAIEQVLGGRIELASRRGQGTRFTIHLPKRPPGRPPSPTSPETPKT